MELGLTANIQVSYLGFVLETDSWFGQFALGASYTDGGPIDIVRLGGDTNADGLDHSARTSELRDLMFGFGGDDTIHSGAGNDYIYGGEGNDSIDGGADDDVLYGEEGVDDIAGGDGDDFICGGSGIDALDGGAGCDTASYAQESLGVQVQFDGEWTVGAETLSSIENLLTTDFADTLTLKATNGLVATLGGDDIVVISDVGDWELEPDQLYLWTGTGADHVLFSGTADAPFVTILRPDSDDRLFCDGVDISSVTGAANYTSFESEGGLVQATWGVNVPFVNAEGVDDFAATDCLSLEYDLASHWLTITYEHREIQISDGLVDVLSESTLHCTVIDFDDGDLGLSGVGSGQQVDLRALLQDLEASVPGIADINSEHAYGLLGI